jgi:2,4-dienoyl-CoA reductase-like NADH-dependent reductase (Old Yellow Enzyme family)
MSTISVVSIYEPVSPAKVCTHPIVRPEPTSYDQAREAIVCERLEVTAAQRRRFPQVKKLGTPEVMRTYLEEQGIDLPLEDEIEPSPGGPLASPLRIATELEVENRFAILPMEGWDGTTDGKPTPDLRRRWLRFGASGASLVWCEATSVVPEGRANPNQLMINPETVDLIGELRSEMVAARAAEFDGGSLVAGLQLTHSGRWSRPLGVPAPLIAYHQPQLDDRIDVSTASVMSDEQLDDLVGTYVEAGVLAADAGFDFVDIKHCHGYLLHELLSARTRPGRYGGSFENRTRVLRSVAQGLRSARPGLGIAVRLSAIDPGPFLEGSDGIGYPQPLDTSDLPFGPGEDGDPLGETHQFLDLCIELGISLMCVTVGSPYYNPHATRPAYHPALDGYLPPREPLAEVAVHLETTAKLTEAHPELTLVGSGYSYLQELLPNAAQYQVRNGRVGMVGLGRMALSYPSMPADVVAGNALEPRLICRTFSDCTTGPRIGLASGCYPLDEHYKKSEARVHIAAAKKEKRTRAG